MPQVYFCVCAEPELDGTHKLYIYNKENTPNVVTGKFEPFTGSYEDLIGLPSINGVPILGSEGTGEDYFLQ